MNSETEQLISFINGDDDLYDGACDVISRSAVELDFEGLSGQLIGVTSDASIYNVTGASLELQSWVSDSGTLDKAGVYSDASSKSSEPVDYNDVVIALMDIIYTHISV